MADSDLTYDLDDLPRFLAELDDGAQLVMGEDDFKKASKVLGQE